jgi:DNA polymerase-3 subunit gamma/tau
VTEPLAIKYRPQTFDDLVGQPAVQVILRQMIKVGQVPAALLFDGCRGTGKTTTARILAAALNCHEDNRPCGTCPSCKATHDGSSLDVIEIDAASNGLVDDIRALRQQVLYRNCGDYRIVILDEAHSISPAGFNALLKTLEEPPPNTLFMLLTTEPAKILPTVASRCMPFTFKRLTVADIAARLAHIARAEGHTVEDDLLVLIAERADGAMRDAIMLFDQIARIGLTTAEQYQRLTGHVDHAPGILDRLLHADMPGAFTALDAALMRVADPATIVADLIGVLRDVLVLRCDGEITKTGLALATRQNLALAIETPTVLAALKVLWQLKTQLRLDDARSSLELAVVMLSEIFHTLPSTPPAPATRMSLSEMGRLP